MMKLAFYLLTLSVCINYIYAQAAAEGDKKDSALKCHVCNQNTDEKCADPFKGEFLKTCEASEKFCRKTVQYVDGKTTVVRQCGEEPFKGGQEGCYKTAGKSTQHVCTCSKEGCNSGNFMQSSLILLVSSLLFKFLF